MDVLSFNSGGSVQFDDNGLIIEESSSNDDYSCNDFEKSDSNDLDSLLLGGSSDMSSMMGGIGQKVSDITKRVTIAVLQSDRAVEEAELTVLSGNFTSSSNANNAVINSCIEYTLDKHQHISCIKRVLNSQLATLAKYPTETYPRDANYETTLKEFKNSVIVANEFLACGNNCTCKEDSISNFSTARACATNLSEELSKKEKDITNGITTSNLRITQITKDPATVFFQQNGSTLAYTADEFVKHFCNKRTYQNTQCYPSTNTFPGHISSQTQICHIILDDHNTIHIDQPLPKSCTQ
jgi:hypothetical protein